MMLLCRALAWITFGAIPIERDKLMYVRRRSLTGMYGSLARVLPDTRPIAAWGEPHWGVEPPFSFAWNERPIAGRRLVEADGTVS